MSYTRGGSWNTKEELSQLRRARVSQRNQSACSTSTRYLHNSVAQVPVKTFPQALHPLQHCRHTEAFFASCVYLGMRVRFSGRDF